MTKLLEDDQESTKVASIGELQQELASRSQRDRAYLIVLAGMNVGEMFRVTEGETFIGRGQSTNIRIDDDGVSRRHARLVQSAGAVSIEDLGSSNGTHVNGAQVTRHTLSDGDKIRLGSTTILKFTYHDHLDESFQQQMYDAALRDALTKAFNKKYFLDRVETEVAFARRHHTPLSVLMFDVDHFKKVNDTHGHIAGDFVLAKLAKVTAATVRTEDVFARYGGEEFGVICRGVTLAAAGVFAERLRGTVAQTPFDHEGTPIAVTISIGVAGYPEVGYETGLAIIGGADEALYEAKRSGRNRVLLKNG